MLDGLDLEVEPYQTEDQRFQVLHQVVEDPEPLRIGRLRHINQRANLSGLTKNYGQFMSVRLAGGSQGKETDRAVPRMKYARCPS